MAYTELPAGLMPSGLSRANTLLGFGATGRMALYAPTPGDDGTYTAPGTGGTLRTLAAVLDEVVYARNYGAVGNGVADDTLAIQRALNTGKSVSLGKGSFRITATLILNVSGQKLLGAGPWSTVLDWAGGDSDVILMRDQQFMSVRDLMIRPKSGSAPLAGGWAINMSRIAANPLGCDISNVLIHSMFGGILLRSVTEPVLYNIQHWALTGPIGLLFDGSAAAASFGATLDLVRFGGMTGNLTTTLVQQDSYGYSLRMRQCILINGGIGFRMCDTANTGTSYPMWCLGVGQETDHPQLAGVSLEAGEGFSWGNSWIGSTLAGPGVRTSGTWRGEMTLNSSRVMGNKTHGIELGAGVDAIITGCAIGDNGPGGAGAYHGVYVAPGVSRVVVTGNKIGDLIGSGGNAQGYGVYVSTGASDNYQVVGNLTVGNTTGDVFDGGTGVQKLVQLGYSNFKRMSFGDIQYFGALSGGVNPLLNFDANDYLLYDRTTNTLNLAINSGNKLSVSETRMTSAVPLSLAAYTVATLPVATSFARGLIYVSDGTANKRLAISDGSNWRFPDGAIVS